MSDASPRLPLFPRLAAWWQSGAPWWQGGSSGHTLAEAVVALALFVGVLVPAAAAVIGVLAQHPGAREALALATAQAAVEEAALHPTPGHEVWQTADGRWEVQRAIEPAGTLLLIRVSVADAGATTPRVTLTTLRPSDGRYP